LNSAGILIKRGLNGTYYDKELIRIRIVEAMVLFTMLYAFVFYVLKKAGIINTPLILELSPQILALITGFAVVFGFFEFFVKLKNLPDDHKRLAKRVDNIGLGLTNVENNIGLMKKDMAFLKEDSGIIKSDVKYLMKCKNYRAAY
jgi:hypothetical protein